MRNPGIADPGQVEPRMGDTRFVFNTIEQFSEVMAQKVT
jgi:hypothetical protein